MILEFEASEYLATLAWQARKKGESCFRLSYEDLTQNLAVLFLRHPEVRVHMGPIELTSFERKSAQNIKIEYFEIEVNNLQSKEMKRLLQNNLPSDDICDMFLSF